jgi:electron transfer flavoprotein beta subunit
VAENLGLPHVTDVRKIEGIDAEGTIVVERLMEEGYLRLKTKLPMVMTVVKEINEPRLPSLKGKLAAKKAAITVWTAKDLELDGVRIGLNGSPTQVMKIFTPPKPAGGKVIHGEPHHAVAQLLEELQKAGIPLGKAKAEAKHG